MTKKKIQNKPNKYNEPKRPLKIDLGCGKNKKGADWIGVDELKFDGVDVVMNIGKDKWPWKDGSVDEIHASHFVEHLYPEERIHFANELYRVLKKPEYENGALIRGFATIIVPHWTSQRAYGDMTHKWPPVAEFWFYYLDRDWRAINAPHNQDYRCHLNVNWGYSTHPSLNGRSQETVNFALQNYKEAAMDIIATFNRKD